MNTKKKRLKLKKKPYIMLIISFFVITLILGIKSAYAYYYDEVSKPMLAVAVGDFDIGNGDVNIMIFKEISKDSNGKIRYARTYGVPAMGYTFDAASTKCSFDTGNTTCARSTDGTPIGNCSYTYNDRTFTLTSNQKVTCKFYFNAEAESDINVSIMVEDSRDENGKINYKNVNFVPGIDYKYISSSCDNDTDTEVIYDEKEGKFTVKTPFKNKCYAYFNKIDSEVTTKIYVQDETGGHVLVDSIPTDKTYILSTEKSVCKIMGTKDEINREEEYISYENGKINIIGMDQKVSCYVYLDLQQ